MENARLIMYFNDPDAQWKSDICDVDAPSTFAEILLKMAVSDLSACYITRDCPDFVEECIPFWKKISHIFRQSRDAEHCLHAACLSYNGYSYWICASVTFSRHMNAIHKIINNSDLNSFSGWLTKDL